MTFTLFDSDGYKLEITGFRLAGSFLSPHMILDGQMIDPHGNGMLIKGVKVGINEIKALIAFFQQPDDEDLSDAARKATQDAFTNSIKGIMAASKG